MRSGRRGADAQGEGRERAPESVRKGLVCSAAGNLPWLRDLPAPLPALRGGPHRGAGRRREDRGAEPAAALRSYCNRVKGTRGKDGYRLKMAELRADNVATGVMADERRAVLTGKRLARYHRGEFQA